jgi:regulator of nonsense transcripts 1
MASNNNGEVDTSLNKMVLDDGKYPELVTKETNDTVRPEISPQWDEGNDNDNGINIDEIDDDSRSIATETSGLTADQSILTNNMSRSGMSRAVSDGGSAYEGSEYGDIDEDEGDEEIEWPEHACRYCGIHEPSCVVKCVKTGKWFCNGRGNTNQSHIVHHLVRSKYKEVQLHKDSPLGDAKCECYQCGSTNVFLLGFIPAKKEEVVVLLCRDPCLRDGALKDSEWDLKQWSPLIQDKTLVPWLVSQPPEKAQIRARQISGREIIKLEELWRENPEATVFDLDKAGYDNTSDELPELPIRFQDGYDYQNSLAPLVYMESEENRRLKENSVVENLAVTWEKSLGGVKRVAVFSARPFNDMDSDTTPTPGDELVLKLDEDSAKVENIKSIKNEDGTVGYGWSGKGKVSRVDDEEEMVYLEMSTNKDVPFKVTETYSVEFVWKSTTYDRMQHAMKTFAVDDTSVSGYLYHILLGHDVPKQLIKASPPADLRVPNMPALNPPQELAVRSALCEPLSLIQGPPGTGKTLTSASIVYHLRKQNESNKKQDGKGQVLVCAPSNVAVDQLAEKISRTGLKVVRMAAKSRESEGVTMKSVEKLSLHHMVKYYEGPGGKDLRRYQLLKDETGELVAKDLNKYKALVRRIEREILTEADVICCTCVGAGDPRLKDFRFHQLLIDESTQSMEAECLIPIVMGVKQLVLVGDHCQLGPVVMCKKAANAHLTRSLFERLVWMGSHRPKLLSLQYRMHPALSEWPSVTFYEGQLQNGVAEEERNLEHLPELQTALFDGIPMKFIISNGAEEIAGGGTSYLNRMEATMVEKLVTLMMKAGSLPEEIGVITPYQGQRSHVSTHMILHGAMTRSLYEEVEVASVDSFQGREKDFIILSCVRSNENQGIGFLRDPRRLNVALTRARYGVIIIGNARLLMKNQLWNTLLRHLSDREAILEGTSVQTLALSNIVIQEPRMPRRQDEQTDRERRELGVIHTNYRGIGDAQNAPYQGGVAQNQGSMAAFGNVDGMRDMGRGWGDSAYETLHGVGAGAMDAGGPLMHTMQDMHIGNKRSDSRHDSRYETDSLSAASYNTRGRSLAGDSLPQSDTDRSS